MAYFPPTNPAPLGYVKPTPGTPLSVLAGTPAAANQGFTCFALRFDAERSPGTPNTGRVYIGLSGMNTVTGAGVLLTLEPGQNDSYHGPDGSGNKLQPDTLFVDVDTAGDGVRISAMVV